MYYSNNIRNFYTNVLYILYIVCILYKVMTFLTLFYNT